MTAFPKIPTPKRMADRGEKGNNTNNDENEI
jgi:hypothetical protein